jgi:hypothetical protein
VTPPAGPGQPANRDLGVAVAIPTPRPYPDCASAPPGTAQCVVYLSAAVVAGVSAEGYSNGTVVPGGATETGNCVGHISAGSVQNRSLVLIVGIGSSMAGSFNDRGHR